MIVNMVDPRKADQGNTDQMNRGAARGAKGAGAGFVPFVLVFVEKVRQILGAGRRLGFLRFTG